MSINKISEKEYEELLKQEMIEPVKMKQTAVNGLTKHTYNHYINESLNSILNSNVSIYKKYGLYEVDKGDLLSFLDFTIKDHRFDATLDIYKSIPKLYGSYDIDDLNVCFIKYPLIFASPYSDFKMIKDAVDSGNYKFNQIASYKARGYFNGFNTYLVNPIYYKYCDGLDGDRIDSSFQLVHFPRFRFKGVSEEIAEFLNNGFIQCYGNDLLFEIGD